MEQKRQVLSFIKLLFTYKSVLSAPKVQILIILSSPVSAFLFDSQNSFQRKLSFLLSRWGDRSMWFF